MYQFYYSDNREYQHAELKQKISDHFNVEKVRPTMWEEHCLECSAPVCFGNCAHYAARRDGRCMRFDNGIRTFEKASACCGQGARLKFRKWANMMTIIYPGMLSPEEYNKLTAKNEKLGKKLFITGKGRCNITNACDMDTLFANVVTNEKFMYSSYAGACKRNRENLCKGKV